MIAAVLLALGYVAVTSERSQKEFLTVKAVSMSFVNSQGTPNISNWNMSIVNNGTVTFILGQVCQRTPGTDNCNVVAPSFSGHSPYYLKPEQSMWFMLAHVNTTRPIWELHLQGWPWIGSQPPTEQDIVKAEGISMPTTEWLFYNSTSNTFNQ